jgi:hypothetical protein
VRKIDEGTRVAWQLFEDDERSLVLSVLCGDIGIYEVKIKLLDNEVVRYKNDGPSALDEVARRVSRSSR